MYHPTTRVLTVLELLQSHQRLSGPELAARLEVDVRTTRRYIAMLQDLGIPIEAERGRNGAYTLRPGTRLPPLIFTEDEALALTLGLLAARRLGLTATAPAVEGALAKIERLLPSSLRGRVQALQTSLMFDLRPSDDPPDQALLMALSDAIRDEQRVALHYRAANSEETYREVDPYGLVFREGRWYVAGYCHLRRGMRVFRLNRVQNCVLRPYCFTRPEGFDSVAFVIETLANIPSTWTIEVLLLTDEETARKRVRSSLGALEVHADGMLLRSSVENLEWIARDLIQLALPLRVVRPLELKEVLKGIADEILRMAE